MPKTYILFLSVALGLVGSGIQITAQDVDPNIHVVVNMVQLNVAVTDKKGNYVTGLRPQDFAIAEDGIPEKIATFGEGNEPIQTITAGADPSQTGRSRSSEDSAMGPNSMIAGSNVFILFDTSNYMYRGFVFAQDAIADFVRSKHITQVIFGRALARDWKKYLYLSVVHRFLRESPQVDVHIVTQEPEVD